MKIKPVKGHGIAYIPMLLLIILSLFDSTFKLVCINYNFKSSLIIMIVSLIYIYLITSVKYVWITLIGTPYIFYRYGTWANINQLITKAPEFFQSVYNNNCIESQYSGYFFQLMLLTAILMALIFYYTTVIKGKAEYIIIFGCGLLVTYYFLGAENIFNNSQLFLSTTLFLMAYTNYDNNIRHPISEKIKLDKKYTLKWYIAASAFVLFITFITTFMPVSPKPIRIQSIQEKIAERFESSSKGRGVGGYRGKKEFSISSTGYQPNPSRLGGAIKISKTPALRVYSSADITGMHLRGSIKDYYNGYLWLKSENTKKPGDFKESGEGSASPHKNISMEIYNLFSSTTIFNALHPFKIVSDNNSALYYVDEEEEITAEKAMKTSYKISSIIYGYTSEMLMNAGSSKVENIKIKKYLQISPEVPDRVYNLTYKITEKYSNYYMKASAIENYLKKNFPYSLDTSSLPHGRDFVDYFLFDEKKGSCTYYASAMAVMCRIAGIPARYVEGYYAGSSIYKNGYTDVSNADAHAWVELYFNNIGWVTFDSTPGRQSMAVGITEENPNEGELKTIPENKTEPEIPKDQEINPSAPGNKMISTKKRSIEILIIIITIVIIATSGILVYKRKNKRDVKKELDRGIKRIIAFAGYCGIKYGRYDTMSEYIDRISEGLKIDAKETGDIIDNYLYGKVAPSKRQLKIVRDMEENLRKIGIRKYGKFTFFFKELLGIVFIGNIKTVVNIIINFAKIKVKKNNS